MDRGLIRETGVNNVFGCSRRITDRLHKFLSTKKIRLIFSTCAGKSSYPLLFRTLSLVAKRNQRRNLLKEKFSAQVNKKFRTL